MPPPPTTTPPTTKQKKNNSTTNRDATARGGGVGGSGMESPHRDGTKHHATQRQPQPQQQRDGSLRRHPLPPTTLLSSFSSNTPSEEEEEYYSTEDAYLTEEGQLYRSGANRSRSTTLEGEGEDGNDGAYNDTDGPSLDGHRRLLAAAASSSSALRQQSSFVTAPASGAETATGTAATATTATTAVSLSMAAVRGGGGGNDNHHENENGDEYGYYDFSGGPLGGDIRTTTRGPMIPSTSLPIRAMGATLKRLSLAEQFRIPQHLIDTLLFLDGDDANKASKTKEQLQQQEQGQQRNTVDPKHAAAAAAATAPRQPLLRRGQLASVASVNLVSSGEYDGDGDDDDDDSDAILRSRRSSQEDQDGDGTAAGDASTLPSTVAEPNHSDDAYYRARRDQHRHNNDTSPRERQPPPRAPWDPQPVHVVEGRFAAESGLRSPRQHRPSIDACYPGGNGAVAAIIQSISDELHHVDQIVSTSGGDEDDDAFFPEESLSPTMNMAQLGGRVVEQRIRSVCFQDPAIGHDARGRRLEFDKHHHLHDDECVLRLVPVPAHVRHEPGGTFRCNWLYFWPEDSTVRHDASRREWQARPGRRPVRPGHKRRAVPAEPHAFSHGSVSQRQVDPLGKKQEEFWRGDPFSCRVQLDSHAAASAVVVARRRAGGVAGPDPGVPH
jgi:hypothetical protein